LAAVPWTPSARSLSDFVAEWAVSRPSGLAFVTGDHQLTWPDYDRRSTDLAAALIDRGFEPGDRVATVLPDGPDVHVVWLAAEKAGLVCVGIGARAGDREVRHLVSQSGARALMRSEASGRAFDGLGVEDLVLESLAERSSGQGLAAVIQDRRLQPMDLFMLNSTSGTTGLPKLVMHHQDRWMYFHRLAVEAAGLNGDDVFCSAIPSPFGFGLWTAHFTPALLGCPTYVQARFDADGLVSLLASARVTVLAAVTTQLILLLNSPGFGDADLSALRVTFTGGEAVPYEKAAEFEDRTGCKVLQFYGSNETGAVSRTTLEDDRQHRLTTAGRTIEEMEVRLFDPATGEGVQGRGQPGCRGPAMCLGYYNDPGANAQLYTKDGWMLMGDLVEIDADDYLTVIGRTSDIIIRGGKNISAPAVEAEVMTHPDVAMAAAVSMPDAVFGERVCIYVQPRPGRSVSLDDVVAHLDSRGVTKEWFPEYLVEMEQLPHSSGGKVAKGELRADIRRRIDWRGEV
jgi:acyl-CoA synthetase